MKKEYIGTKCWFSDDTAFTSPVLDVLVDIVMIDDEEWYQTEDNGLMGWFRPFSEKLEKIEIGGNYTCIEDSSGVEVLEFKDFELKNDSYQERISTVIYIDENDNVQSMQIDTFSKKHQ